MTQLASLSIKRESREMDTMSRYRVARLSLFPPMQAGHHARYAVVSHVIKRGIPSAQILVDGILPNQPCYPTTEELLEAFDSAIRQHMLAR